jgi:hypothetical protein
MGSDEKERGKKSHDFIHQRFFSRCSSLEGQSSSSFYAAKLSYRKK